MEYRLAALFNHYMIEDENGNRVGTLTKKCGIFYFTHPDSEEIRVLSEKDAKTLDSLLEHSPRKKQLEISEDLYLRIKSSKKENIGGA